MAATEENIHETRAAKAGGTLVVDVDFGSIDIAPGDNDKVVIDAHRKIEASSKEKEEEYFKAVPITITTEGDKVIVRAIHKTRIVRLAVLADAGAHPHRGALYL